MTITATTSGDFEREGTISAAFALNTRDTLGVGLEHQDVDDRQETGRRTDLALRYTRQLAEDTAVYAFVQGTLDEEGLGRNDRAGVGRHRRVPQRLGPDRRGVRRIARVRRSRPSRICR